MIARPDRRRCAGWATTTRCGPSCCAAEGKSFSAGATWAGCCGWPGYGHDENLADAGALADADAGARTSCPSRRSHGSRARRSAAASAWSLACDFAIASDAASLQPVGGAAGADPGGDLALCRGGHRRAGGAALFPDGGAVRRGGSACASGWSHQVVPAGELDAGVDAVLARLAEGGPAAQRAAKDLIFAVAHRPVDAGIIQDTAERIATIRASAEGREGLAGVP